MNRRGEPPRKIVKPSDMRRASWLYDQESSMDSGARKRTESSSFYASSSHSDSQLESDSQSESEESEGIVNGSILDTPQAASGKKQQNPAVGKKRKSDATKINGNWIYKHLIKSEVDEEGITTYSCPWCLKGRWTSTREKKFQSGNAKRHLSKRHPKELKAAGTLSQENIASTEVAYNNHALNKDIFAWIARERLPFRLVESPQLIKIIEKLGGKLLGRTQLIDTFLPIVLGETIESIKATIGKGEFYFSITSDGWSTCQNKSIHWSSTTLHFIDNNWNTQRLLLDIGDLGTSATAEKIYSLWRYQLQRWELAPANLIACVADGASNYQAAGKKWSGDIIWCYCHRLHLVAKDILQGNEEVTSCYKECKDIVKMFNKSNALTAGLKKSMKKSCETRWNSAALMFESFLHNKEQIPTLLKKTRFEYTFIDWNLIEFLHNLLQHLAQVLVRLEADTVPTMNVVIPCVYSLNKKWEEMKQKPEYQGYTSIVNLSINTLDIRISKTNLETCALLACWLDPRFSRFLFIPNEDQRNNALDFCIDQAGYFLANEVDQRKTTGRDAFLLVDSQQDSVADEIKLYEQMFNNDNDFDLLAFWRGQKYTLPLLSKFAKRYICIPASSASSERVFSSSNLVCSKLRGRLSSERAKAITYISVNATMNKLPEKELDWAE